MSTIGKIESERMAALACVNRVLLRAAELDWQGTALGIWKRSRRDWSAPPLAPGATKPPCAAR